MWRNEGFACWFDAAQGKNHHHMRIYYCMHTYATSANVTLYQPLCHCFPCMPGCGYVILCVTYACLHTATAHTIRIGLTVFLSHTPLHFTRISLSTSSCMAIRMRLPYRVRILSHACTHTHAHHTNVIVHIRRIERNAGNYLSGYGVLGENVYSVVGMMETDHSRIGRQRE